MRWLHEKFMRPGKRPIAVSRTFGNWDVRVNGCGQTTPYTNAMWKDAYARLSGMSVARILLLGLGAGGGVPVAHRQFGGCTITAVEYDPAMIELARELKLYKPWDFPRVIESDAADVICSINETFDLVVMDLFDGPEPSTLTCDETFLVQIKNRLAPKGVFLANVYKRQEYLETPKRLFARSSVWQFGGNTLGAFTENETLH